MRFSALSKLAGVTALAGFMVCAAPQTSRADEITFSASKDSYLRQGAKNTNEGANRRLDIRHTGKRRALIAFDLAPLNSLVPAGEEIVSATLKVYVTNNNQLWGNSGRPVSVHSLLADWTEGNGNNSVPAKKESDSGEEGDLKKNRGSGAGVTWKCSTDSNVGNGKTECAKPRWNGGSYNSTPTDTIRIFKTTTGNIDFDVTDDVLRFAANTFPNYGWLIKRTVYRQGGGIWIASREATSHQPALVVETGYNFDMDGASEVPPVTTTATGTCSAVLSNDETSLAVKCTHNVQNVTMAHVHQAAVGVDGSIVCDLGNGTSPISVNCPMTGSLVTALRAGNLYVNVHSVANSGGEIRGQIVNN